MEKRLRIPLALAILWLGTAMAVAFELNSRPRLVVLTDIGGDPDDQQSLVRLLVHANEFEIEGLIASASGTPGELKDAVTRTDLIHEQIDAYAGVFPGLTNHAAGFPSPGQLRSVIRSGNPQRGREAIGDGHSTEGSEWILAMAGRDDPRPLNIVIWGGQTDLAQACWDYRGEHGGPALKKLLSNLRIHDIADQDGIFEWMNAEFEFPFYVLNRAEPGHDKREAVFRGMYLGGDESLTSREWVELHVRSDHGPLGALYPSRTWTAPNPHSTLKEGDTPSWFYFLRHGLNDPRFPDYGGWGGRFELRDGAWRDAEDTLDGVTNARTTVSRWRGAFQNQFRARMDWCVNDFHNANHPPIALVRGDSSKEVIRLSARSGERLTLSAAGSMDPDADALRYRWWRYWEPGTYRGELAIRNADKAACHFEIPAVGRSRTIHIVLEVTDNGEPELTSFRRIIVEALPAR